MIGCIFATVMLQIVDLVVLDQKMAHRVVGESDSNDMMDTVLLWVQ